MYASYFLLSVFLATSTRANLKEQNADLFLFYFYLSLIQAYDGHMNLIMSEVEETIMLVDAESVANGQGVVNVSFFF